LRVVDELTPPFRHACAINPSKMSVALTKGYTCTAIVWALCLVQGTFSVAPCQTLIIRVATNKSSTCLTVQGQEEAASVRCGRTPLVGGVYGLYARCGAGAQPHTGLRHFTACAAQHHALHPRCSPQPSPSPLLLLKLGRWASARLRQAASASAPQLLQQRSPPLVVNGRGPDCWVDGCILDRRGAG
jgi:hypothetical protein